MVISATAGAAPTDHALPKASSPARSSWRTWPHIKDRSHVPTVDGADTANGNTTSAEPARSRSVSSMNEPPTSIDATTLSAFAPDPRPAPGGRTRPIDERLQPEAIHHRARQQQPGVGHQRPVVEHRLDLVDPARYTAHRKCLLTWPERPS